MPTPVQAKFRDLKKQIADAKKTASQTAKTLFTEMSADLFDKNPNLVSFAWSQYTPYWNDGDTCTFDANTEYPTVSFTTKDGRVIKFDENYGETSFVDEDGEIVEEVTDTAPYDKEMEALSTKVVKFLKEFENEDLEIMFDDHKLITVNRDGKVDVEDYEHE
jgi:hypothetical protein